MENTNCGSNCPYVKSGLCKTDCECPNFIESAWQNKDGEIKFFKDCIPKRLMIQQNNHHQRIEGLQSALEQQRNAYSQLSSVLNDLLYQIKNISTVAIPERSKKELTHE